MLKPFRVAEQEDGQRDQYPLTVSKMFLFQVTSLQGPNLDLVVELLEEGRLSVTSLKNLIFTPCGKLCRQSLKQLFTVKV